MPRPVPPFPIDWHPSPLAGSVITESPEFPTGPGLGWHELGQSWRPEPEPGFNAGWAHIRWNPTGLLFESVCLQHEPANRARTLNERTWELGDIAEFFLQETVTGRYLELHVTPENQRLQLQWPAGALAAFRAGRAAFEEFTLGPDTGLSSTATVWPDRWGATLTIPASVLGFAGFTSGQTFRTAVCRYDCAGAAAPVFSSTALLQEPSFHRPAEWSSQTLSQP